MVRTRVGYSGGTKDNPTYHSIGNYSETVQMDYDPTKISYDELLDSFWEGHNPTAMPFSRQYMSIIFYRNDEQKKLAEASKAREEAKLGKKVITEILPYSKFYLAEAYHQKYDLQYDQKLMADFNAMYPDFNDFVNSTAAARINGFITGYGTREQLQNEIDSFGLSDTGKARLLEFVKRLSH